MIQSLEITQDAVIWSRRRHFLRHEDDRHDPVELLGDAIALLELVEQVGHRQLVVRVHDRAGLRRLAARWSDSVVDLDACVLSVYSCTAFSTASRKSFRFWADSLLASTPNVVVALPSEMPMSKSPSAAEPEIGLALRLRHDVRLDARGRSLLVVERGVVLPRLLARPACVAFGLDRVPALLLGREGDRLDELARRYSAASIAADRC